VATLFGQVRVRLPRFRKPWPAFWPSPNSRVTSRQIESGSVLEPIQAWEGPNF
jgi:hypothetical protein